MPELMDHEPVEQPFRERIGDNEYLLDPDKLNVFEDVKLWHENPRLIPFLPDGRPESEDELEAALQRTKGYDALRRSIGDVGQLERIYVWRQSEEVPKYLVLEGATRVTVLRELARKHRGQPEENNFKYVKAKVLPPEFPEKDRAILLARIHVRGSGVRSWGRHIQAKFIHEQVTEQNGQMPVMNLTEVAEYMGKSTSWASRLMHAYEFSQRFVDYVDSPDAEELAVENFSTLEEISKSTGFGPRVREDSDEGQELREQVFDMVKADVFKEYRDARYMQQFYEDDEKWEQLKSLEPNIAHELANEIKAGSSSVEGKIQSIHKKIEREVDREGASFEVEDLERLEDCVTLVSNNLAGDVGLLRLRLRRFADALQEATLRDVQKVTRTEFEELITGVRDLTARLREHTEWAEGYGKV